MLIKLPELVFPKPQKSCSRACCFFVCFFAFSCHSLSVSYNVKTKAALHLGKLIFLAWKKMFGAFFSPLIAAPQYNFLSYFWRCICSIYTIAVTWCVTSLKKMMDVVLTDKSLKFNKAIVLKLPVCKQLVHRCLLDD